MQISSTPTAYGGNEAQRLLNMLLKQQPPRTGQDLPSGDSTTPAAAPAANTQTTAPSATQFASNTLASLLSAQEAPPSPADVAAKVIKAVDTNGDGSLSLSEVETALGLNSTSGSDTTSGASSNSGADALSPAFGKIDANGDGQISADELTNALQAQNSDQGAQGVHRGRHHHHHGGAEGVGDASSTDLAKKLLGSADSDGDGSLSLNEIGTALGGSSASSRSDVLSSSFKSLDTDGDGKLSASEISAGIDAFRTAHHWGAPQTAQATTSQAVTA